MNKLLLTLVIAISTVSLHGMEPILDQQVAKSDCIILTSSEPKLSPITLAQEYYLLHPEIARQIFLLHLSDDNNLFSKELQSNCEDPSALVKHINTLIHSYGYSLANKLCDLFFPHAKISLCTIKDKKQKSPLHHAIKENYPEVAQIFINIAGDKTYELLSMQDCENQWIALHSAVYKKNIECVKLILNTAGDKAWELLDIRDHDNRSAWYYAAFSKTPEIVKLILDAAGDNVPRLIMQTAYHRTALHNAADSYETDDNDVEIAKLILNAAGKYTWRLLSMEDIYPHRTALYFAVYHNNINMVKLLLDAAGNNAPILINKYSPHDNTVLHDAVYHNNIEMVKLLLDAAGNDVSTLLARQGFNGKIAFDCASEELQKVMKQYMNINQ